MIKEITTKHIIQRTLFTLVGALLLAVAVCMIFFPKFTAGVAGDLGLDGAEIAFEKISYEKTGDINSLAKILNYEIYTEDSEEIAEYGMQMLSHEYYEEYVAFLGTSSITSMSYSVYAETYILEALYLEGLDQEMLAVLSLALQNEYETFGVGINLCNAIAENQDAEVCTVVLQMYEESIEGASDLKAYNITLEAMIISKDLASGEYAVWEARLAELDEKFA